ncbi:MAG: response regulator [bacterium]|nr:response regulator [bacterium]
MSSRNVLLIHESSTLRRIIKKVLLGELEDIEVKEASSAHDGLSFIRKNKYGAIICDYEVADMELVFLFETIRNEAVNKATPFILLTAKLDTTTIRKLQEKGMKYMVEPFEPLKITKMVDSVVDARKLRAHERLNIPETFARIHIDSQFIESRIVNISMGGILGDLKYSDEIPKLAQQSKIEVLFPGEYGNIVISLDGICLRQQVMIWSTPKIPGIVRLAWKFDKLDNLTLEPLEKALEKAHNSLTVQNTP